MTNNDSLLDMSPRTRLKAEVTWLMLKGAGYAALFILAIWASLVAIRAVGLVLPEESQQAADPGPVEFIEWAERVAAERAAPAVVADDAAPLMDEVETAEEAEAIDGVTGDAAETVESPEEVAPETATDADTETEAAPASE